MQVPQSYIGGKREHPARVYKRHSIQEAGDGPTVFGIENGCMQVAEAIMIEPAHSVLASSSGKHKERNLLRGRAAGKRRLSAQSDSIICCYRNKTLNIDDVTLEAG